MYRLFNTISSLIRIIDDHGYFSKPLTLIMENNVIPVFTERAL